MGNITYRTLLLYVIEYSLNPSAIGLMTDKPLEASGYISEVLEPADIRAKTFSFAAHCPQSD